MDTYDFIVIGSGFGGSVSAMRLAQKGYRVAVLEKGKRYRKTDFPETNRNIQKAIWMPRLRCFGIQAITLIKGLMLLHGVGVGGGSLVYAGTLIRPKNGQFALKEWPDGLDWVKELDLHFETASRMLGIAITPELHAGENLLRQVGEKLGVPHTFQPTPVGVYFGKPGQTVSDPYFNGMGPERTGCCYCGGCMVGCRHASKNTLDYNYLYFAEKWGTRIFAETQVLRIETENDGYQIETLSSTRWFGAQKKYFFAKKVIFSAGVLGTVELLLKNRDVYQTLPNFSPCLGKVVRTNGESLTGATRIDNQGGLAEGVAIGAMIQADDTTKIEAVRYPKGSGFMRLLAVPLTPEGNWFTRPFKLLARLFLRSLTFIKMALFVRDWADNTLILLAMQTTDHRMCLKLGARWTGFGKKLRGEMDDGQPVPCYLPVAQKAAQILADEMQGEPQNVISEVLLGIPATAHILGGCCLGNSATDGVVDQNHEVFGYPGLYVCDGSVIPCNLGANPSLTITALAERFAAQFDVHPDLSDGEWQKRQIRFSVRES